MTATRVRSRVALATPDSVSLVRCPACATVDDKVVDSRASDDGTAIRRRRECLGCGRRFTTFERLEEAALAVIKRGDSLVLRNCPS